MSLKSMTWAFAQPLNGNEKVVLLALADFADDDGLCWPSMPKIAEKSYLSVRTVQRIILALSDQGYMQFERRTAENGRATSSMYRLIFDGDKLSPYGDTGDTTPVTLLSPTNEPSLEPSVEVLPIAQAKDVRGSRIPDDFVPDESCHRVARENCIQGIAFQNQLDAFMDYWRAVPGAKGRKLDWQGTFRNWLRNSKQFKAGNSNGTRQSNRPTVADTFAAIDARLDAAQAELDARLQKSGNQNFSYLS